MPSEHIEYFHRICMPKPKMIYIENIASSFIALTFQMLRLLLSNAQERRYFWEPS